MLDQILSDAKEELESGYSKKKHPFRYCTLATTENNISHQRTVVLRDMDDTMNLFIYTDHRSTKIKHLLNNPKASILFYHPKKMLQLQVQGRITIHTEGNEVKKRWGSIQGRSRNDYSTINPPGSKIKNPDEVEYDYEQQNFTVLKFTPDHLEYLRLKRPNHIRAVFTRKNHQWQGSFIVP